MLPKVCIIGAGCSGFTTAKALADRGIPFDCFDMSDQIGGNWVFKNRNGRSACYQSLHIDTSKYRMQFEDLPLQPGCAVLIVNLINRDLNGKYGCVLGLDTSGRYQVSIRGVVAPVLIKRISLYTSGCAFVDTADYDDDYPLDDEYPPDP